MLKLGTAILSEPFGVNSTPSSQWECLGARPLQEAFSALRCRPGSEKTCLRQKQTANPGSLLESAKKNTWGPKTDSGAPCILHDAGSIGAGVAYAFGINAQSREREERS